MSLELLRYGNTNLVCLGLMTAHRSIMRYMNAAVKKSGMTINQIYLLFLIDKYRGDHISMIAEKGMIHRTTILRGLENIKGYVSMHKNIDMDSRFLYPAITKKGADFLEIWMPKVLELEEGLEITTGDGEAFVKFVNFFSSEVAQLKVKLPNLK